MSSLLPAGVQATDIATSRLRTHVLRSGPRDAPAVVLVHGNVSSARFFAETMAMLGERWRPREFTATVTGFLADVETRRARA